MYATKSAPPPPITPSAVTSQISSPNAPGKFRFYMQSVVDINYQRLNMKQQRNFRFSV